MIIDDDPFIQDLLKDKLNQYFREIEICAIADSGSGGMQAIRRIKPDLVFLDVEMGDMTGFEMLSQLAPVDFKVIFITSYRHYAIKAIRFNALDYLLKPFDLEELRNAMKRFREVTPNHINTAIANFRQDNINDQTLILRTQKGELSLMLREVVHLEADRNYTYIHLANGNKELVSKTLSSLTELLEDRGFFRCHKSHLVNQVHIVSIKSEFVLMTNGSRVAVSRRKRDTFIAWINRQERS
ncbi:MAG: LytTR family DNA-binding domain-containing protein [Saprospiraceae bacterium]|nr:LytTR family DNA-binding domain-containing protein [Saprospiraceae bacterium]